MTEAGKREKKVSIIIPAYNEEESVCTQIENILEIIKDTGWEYELIVVNDGSTDGTAEEIEKHDVITIHHPENMGYGSALKSGVSRASYNYVMITDADGTYPVTAIPLILEKIGTYDMVVGARIGQDVHVPAIRRPAKWFLRKLAAYLAGKDIPDLNSGLRVMRKEVVKRFWHLLPSGFSFTTTITLSMLCRDYLVYYEPISYAKRTGNSKIRPVDAYYFLLLILRTMIFFNPLKVFLPFGAFFFVLGLTKFFIADLPKGNLSDSAMVGILTAFIFWAIGLLSDQLARIGMEQK